MTAPAEGALHARLHANTVRLATSLGLATVGPGVAVGEKRERLRGAVAERMTTACPTWSALEAAVAPHLARAAAGLRVAPVAAWDRERQGEPEAVERAGLAAFGAEVVRDVLAQRPGSGTATPAQAPAVRATPAESHEARAERGRVLLLEAAIRQGILPATAAPAK